MDTQAALLKKALEDGIIDITTIQTMVDMNERKKYLSNHKYSIWQDDKGNWKTSLPDSQSKNNRRVIQAKSKEILEDKVIDFYKSLENEPTLETIFNEWLNQKLSYKEISIQTSQRYKNDFERFFIPKGFNNKKIKYINETQLEEFVMLTIAENNLKAKAWGNLRTVIKGIWKYAKKKGYTDLNISNFISELDISKRSFNHDKKPDSLNVFRQDEIARVIEKAWRTPKLTYLGIILTAYTGLRVGELVAIKWEDVSDKSIFIHRTQIRYTDDNGVIVREIRDTPKTEAGIRYVVINDKIREVLDSIRKINPDTEYMFQKPNDDVPMNTCCFTDALYRICEYLKIPKRGMHTLRKTFSTNLINAGVDENIVINQMGHTDIATTKKYYYYNDKKFDEIANIIGKAISY